MIMLRSSARSREYQQDSALMSLRRLSYEAADCGFLSPEAINGSVATSPRCEKPLDPRQARMLATYRTIVSFIGGVPPQ